MSRSWSKALAVGIPIRRWIQGVLLAIKSMRRAKEKEKM